MKEKLLGTAWITGLLAAPVGEGINWNIGGLLAVVCIFTLGAGLFARD